MQCPFAKCNGNKRVKDPLNAALSLTGFYKSKRTEEHDIVTS
uniref:Uncharacterized protein n=1 Tax=Arundo donax TaxID=35708 RepID=A0A0A8ZLQ9_ARUDO